MTEKVCAIEHGPAGDGDNSWPAVTGRRLRCPASRRPPILSALRPHCCPRSISMSRFTPRLRPRPDDESAWGTGGGDGEEKDGS